MKFRRLWGELMVPALAITSASYAWWEQRDGVYRTDTILYMRVLIVPVAGLALAMVVRSLYRAWRASRERGEESGNSNVDTDGSRYCLRPALLICAAALLVITIDWLGYLIAFALFVSTTLVVMGARSISRIVIITGCTILMLHILFIELLDQPLPHGLLWAPAPISHRVAR